MTERKHADASDASNAVAELSDPELVQQMARGERACLAELYRRHAPRLLTILRGILGDNAEAEDLLHEVFLEAWRSADRYDSQRGSVLTWLSVRSRARALDRRKSLGRRRVVPSEDAMPHAEPVASPEPLSQRRVLLGALQHLPEVQQEVLALAYFEDLSAVEIATTLSVPVGTVKSRTRVALASLRRLLYPDEPATAEPATADDAEAPLPKKLWSSAKL